MPDLIQRESRQVKDVLSREFGNDIWAEYLKKAEKRTMLRRKATRQAVRKER